MDVAWWIKHTGFDFVYWNMLHDAYYFSVSTLPAATKKIIADHLEQCAFPEEYQQEIARIINFMNAGNSLDGSILRMKVQDLDFKRGQDLAVTMPELAQAIEYVKT